MSEPNTPHADAPASNGLSRAFGAAAASSLRHPIRRRPREDGEKRTLPVDEAGAARTVPAGEAADQDDRDGGAADPSRAGAAPVDDGARAGSSSRSLSRVPVRDRRFVDGLLLAAAKASPGSGNLIAFVREHSGGAFDLTPGVVYRELHRLEKERLISVDRGSGARRYALTEVGERVLARRRREWETIDRGLTDLFQTVDERTRERSD